ncbi:MAG: methylenetetrahydrofolate reductase [NAD(P)H] [Candidatus Nitrospinota bacterium M3_3B_026]
MRIKELLDRPGKFLSLEFFPPKESSALPAFFKAVERLKETNPLFVSVTYGAGGGTQAKTLEIVTRLKKESGLEPMAHLTCVGASGERLDGFLGGLAEAGIDNVLALRGDPPEGKENFIPGDARFKHASDLVEFIKERYPQMGVGVAAYPEVHQEAVSAEDDLRCLKHKLDLGADFAITQLFFDNGLYWSFLDKLKKAGIEKPVIPGVMPIFSLKLIKKITSMCGASIPKDLLGRLEAAERDGGEKAVLEAGVETASEQAKRLLEGGAPGVHLYTLNRAEACLDIFRRLSL